MKSRPSKNFPHFYFSRPGNRVVRGWRKICFWTPPLYPLLGVLLVLKICQNASNHINILIKVKICK